VSDERKPPNSSFLATIKAVLWAFFGVRKKGDYEKDATQLNPVHVILAGLAAAVIFVILLIVLVNFIVAQ
jgi:hypothetical protein